MRQALVVGNWKMNGSRASVQELVTGISAGMDQISAEVAVCPPFIHLAEVANQLAGSAIILGAQNTSEQASGAFTGETSVAMLQEYGVQCVIVGHSERRARYGESDALVADKFAVVLAAGLRPILCVGELLEEREQGITEEVVGRQLDAVIQKNGIAALAKGVIAYEPVWAIGTGKTASPEQAQQVHAFIRGRIATLDQEVANGVRILYGGSVKANNAPELFSKADIDGGLIGGASLQANEFLGICQAAS